MSDFFQLFQLSPVLLERITTKLEWKSYVRMQQTCKTMEEFIRTNKNIKVCVPASLTISAYPNGFSRYSLKCKKECHELGFETKRKKKCFEPDFEGLYGIRFENVIVQSENYKFDCDTFKEYRITSKKLDTTDKKDWTPEQIEQLLKILKPVKIKMDGRANKIEALLRAELLTDVDVYLRPEDIPDHSIIQKILEKFLNLKVKVHRSDMDFNLILADRILQYLREPLPNLHSFFFRGYHTRHQVRLPPSNELLEPFRRFNLTFVETHRSGNEIYAHSFECPLGNGRLCKLKVHLHGTEVQFNSVE